MGQEEKLGFWEEKYGFAGREIGFLGRVIGALRGEIGVCIRRNLELLDKTYLTQGIIKWNK